MEYKEILFSTEGEVAFLTLNRPEKINALSKRMIGEIMHALSAVSEDESAKAHFSHSRISGGKLRLQRPSQNGTDEPASYHCVQ